MFHFGTPTISFKPLRLPNLCTKTTRTWFHFKDCTSRWYFTHKREAAENCMSKWRIVAKTDKIMWIFCFSSSRRRYRLRRHKKWDAEGQQVIVWCNRWSDRSERRSFIAHRENYKIATRKRPSNFKFIDKNTVTLHFSIGEFESDASAFQVLRKNDNVHIIKPITRRCLFHLIKKMFVVGGEIALKWVIQQVLN